MSTTCIYCGKVFTKKFNLKFHQENAKYCIKAREESAIKIYTCEFCNKTLGSKYSLQGHLTRCKIKKEHDYKIQKEELENKHILKAKKVKREYDKQIKMKDELIARLKIENEELREQLLEQQGIVKGMQTAPDKRTIYNTNTAYVHPKLVNLPINNIRALTTEFIEERVNDGILTYEKAAKGYSGMLEVICELITHENDNGEIERNYVCTDVSRNSFHRLLKSKKWKADKGGRYLNDMIDRFIDQMDEYKNKAYDIYDQTAHDSMEWPQVDWERKNISKLFSGVVCKEGTGDREDLVNALRKEIAKRASV